MGTNGSFFFSFTRLTMHSIFHAAATLILATYLTRAAMEESSRWVMVAVIGWHVLTEIVLYIHEMCTSKPATGILWISHTAEITQKKLCFSRTRVSCEMLLKHVLHTDTEFLLWRDRL